MGAGGRTARGDGVSLRELGVRVGVTVDTVRKWAHRDRVPDLRADALAVALGLHPSLLWPEWWDEGIRSDRERRPHHAAVQRAWRRRNPERARAAQARYRESLSVEAKRAQNRKTVAGRDPERKRAADAAYRARNRQSLNARQRAWRDANREQLLVAREGVLRGEPGAGPSPPAPPESVVTLSGGCAVGSCLRRLAASPRSTVGRAPPTTKPPRYLRGQRPGW